MPDIDDIEDRGSFEAWLEEAKPPRGAVVFLAHRAAMRVGPLYLRGVAPLRPDAGLTATPFLRCLLTSGVSIGDAPPEVSKAAVARPAVARPAAAASVAVAYAAAAADAAAAAAASAADAAADAAAADAFWRLVSVALAGKHAAAWQRLRGGTVRGNARGHWRGAHSRGQARARKSMVPAPQKLLSGRRCPLHRCPA